ncbi:helix-turn-helix domain-containing protein [Actinomyces graevenitzii]
MNCRPGQVNKRFLSLKERMLIADWHRQGISMRQIAQRLGRSVSTVSRELARNSITRGSYSPYIGLFIIEGVGVVCGVRRVVAG